VEGGGLLSTVQKHRCLLHTAAKQASDLVSSTSLERLDPPRLTTISTALVARPCVLAVYSCITQPQVIQLLSTIKWLQALPATGAELRITTVATSMGSNSHIWV